MKNIDLSDKIKNILSGNKWYHATTKSNYENILDKGIIVDYNRKRELDFGYGFYLTTTEKLAESYITRLYTNNISDDIPVILEYNFHPISWFLDEKYNCAVFASFDDEFAKFVFNNRLNYQNGILRHNYDAIYGVMSDSTPTVLMYNYRAGDIDFNSVIAALKKGNSMKQLSLHNQELCDSIILTRAYEYDVVTKGRKELWNQ